MLTRDPILRAYFRACGGAPRNYARWLYQLGLTPPAAQRRYGRDALALHVGRLAAEFERTPSKLTPAALHSAEDGVSRAARLLTRCGYDTALRRERTARLFYATARRDAIRMLLPDYVPASDIPPERRTAATPQLPAGFAKKRANLKHRLTIERRKEPGFAIAAAEATELARAARMELDRLNAMLYLAQDEAQITLANRRLFKAGARLPPGMRTELRALAAQVRNQRGIVAKLVPAARVRRDRLAKCRFHITQLDAELTELNKKLLG